MSAPPAALSLAWHELCLWHDTTGSGGSVERDVWIEPGQPGEGPEARRRLKSVLDASGLTSRLELAAVTPTSEEQLRAVHSANYLERVRSVAAAGGGSVGPNAPIGARGYEIATLAAGAACAAVDAVCGAETRRGFALVRPAGHHALPDTGMGNCVFNNVAVAVRHALQRWDVGRVAVIDWDVHHGNGTESIFYDDPDVLTISVHQEEWYPPASGRVEARGEGSAAGTNLNLPLPAGCGDGAYAALFDRVVGPVLAAHRPELMLVACGLDANAMDPFGRMLVSADGFRGMAARVAGFADVLCEGRLVAVLEGGYSPLYVPFCGLAVIEELAGERTGIADPYGERYSGVFQSLAPHQDARIGALERLLD